MEQALEAIIIQNKQNSEDTISLLEAIAVQGKGLSDDVETIKKAVKDLKEIEVKIPKIETPTIPEIKVPAPDMAETNNLLKEIKKELNQPQKVNIKLNLV